MLPAKLLPARVSRPHLKEAHTNYQRYQRFLTEPENFDWAIVLLFYSALHLVQAHAISKAKADASVIRPESQFDRDRYVANHLGSIVYEYTALRNASEDARYNLVKRPVAEIQQFHDKCFLKIKNHMAGLGFAW